MTPPPPSIYVLKSNSEDYYRNFKQSIKSNDAFLSYDGKLKAFMKYIGLAVDGQQYSKLIEGKDVKQIEMDIIDFIVFLKERHYSLGSQKLANILSTIIIIMHISGILLLRN